MRAVFAIQISVILHLCLAGCSGLGLISIETERNRYNDAISITSAEQTLGNLVRAKFRENPAFFDVIEVDQSKTAQANLQGGSSNIGALLPLGLLQSTLLISDVPLVKYQPPNSAGYIQQISSPIKLANLARFVNSNSNLSATILLTINRLSPEYSDYYLALYLLSSLDYYGAISFEPVTEDVIRVSLNRSGTLSRSGAQLTDDKSTTCFDFKSSSMAVNTLWSRLTRLFKQNGNAILLRSPNVVAPATIVLTRTALGALREAEEHTITILDRDNADRIRSENAASTCFNSEYYYNDIRREYFMSIYDMWQLQFSLMSQAGEVSALARDNMRALGSRTSVILIETSASKPADAYVSYFRRGVWYSIRDTDNISKKNFSLLGNIIISQSQAPVASTTPTVINVGPR